MPRALLMGSLAFLAACSGGAGGCSALQPFPGGARFSGPKTSNAINVRLSPTGVAYLNQNWQALLESFGPGRKLSFPVSCNENDVGGIIGKVIIADQGGPTGGRLDGVCDCKDRPALADVTVTAFNMVTRAPDTLDVTMQVTIDTGKIYLSKGCIKCSVDLDTARSQPSTNQLRAVVKFSINTRWDQLLAFSVEQIDGTKGCGSSGAQPRPACIDPQDVVIDDECGCTVCGCYVCSSVCDIGDWDPIKGFLVGMIGQELEQTVKSALAQQSCEKCGTGLPNCPRLSSTVTSTCEIVDAGSPGCGGDGGVSGLCVDNAAGGKCVPLFLGVEGQVAPAVLLADMGIPPEAKVGMTVFAGGNVTVDQGISLGMRGGVSTDAVADCVPPQAAPAMPTLNVPNFDVDAPAGGYHAAIGVSQPFLNLAMHHAHQSGALCVRMTSSNVGMLNTENFETFLPSLRKLTKRDGKPAPMMVVLRPARAPTLEVGEGTFDPSTKRPIKPLLTLRLPDVTLDIYAMIDDRFVRLFTLTADVSLPLSLIFDGCSSVQPALGDLKQLVTNIRTANSELLAEDPKALAALIPLVIGWAEPALATALKPFAIPTVGNFKLKVNAAKGVGRIAGTEQYNHLGLYASLLPASAACSVAAPRPMVHVRSVRPREFPEWPEVELEVSTPGTSQDAEYAYRVNGGLWSTFFPAPAGRLAVSHPTFLAQGIHAIEVRVRSAADPTAISQPISVTAGVDLAAPSVELRPNRRENRLEVFAHDAVTPLAELEYAYRVGLEPKGEFGAARPIDLNAVEVLGGVEVWVRDQAGWVGYAVHRAPRGVESRTDFADDRPSSPARDEASGCSAGGGLFPLLALVWAGALRRRRP